MNEAARETAPRSATRVAALALAILACSDPAAVPDDLVFELAEHWPEPPAVQVEATVVVTNSGDDTLSLLDLSDPGLPELARVPVGLSPVELEGPHHAALDPRGEFIYVGISNNVPGAGSGPHGTHGAGTADGHVLKLRARDGVRVASVRVDRNPGDLALSPDGARLYVTHFDLLKIADAIRRGAALTAMEARLAVIDAASMTRVAMVPVCAAPHGVKVSPDGARVYIACYDDQVAVVEVSDPSFPVTRVKVAPDTGGPASPVHQPYALTLSPDGSELWVSSISSRKAQVLLTATLAMDPSRTVLLTGAPVFGDFTADGATLYLPHQGDDRIAVIDTARGVVQREIALSPADCQNVHAVQVVDGGARMLLVCEGDHQGPGSLLALSLPAGAVEHAVPLGVFPDFVGVLRRPP